MIKVEFSSAYKYFRFTPSISYTKSDEIESKYFLVVQNMQVFDDIPWLQTIRVLYGIFSIFYLLEWNLDEEKLFIGHSNFFAHKHFHTHAYGHCYELHCKVETL